MPFKVMIIGAGLSGGLLANGLLTHSTPNEIEVIVFEREEATHAREGYQIRLGAAAVKGMRACLSEDMKMEICRKFGRSGGVMASAPILYDGVDMSVKSDWSKFPEYTKSAPISRSVLRSALSAPLKEQGVVRFGKKFVSYEVKGDGGPDGREQVVAKFADGTEEVGDVLIAADGASSPANIQIGLDNHRINRKTLFWLGKSHLTKEKMDMLPEELRKGPVGVIQDNVVLYTSAYLPDKPGAPPPKEGEFGEFDEKDSALMVAFTTLRSSFPEDLSEVKDMKEHCLGLVKHWNPKILSIIRAVDDNDLYYVTPRYSIAPKKGWRENLMKEHPEDRVKGNHRIWFIGDAIHPMLPTRGMGAQQAMQDTASALPALLSLAKSKAGPTNQEVAKAVAEYEEEMIPRAFYWVKSSGNGDLLKFSKLQLFIMGQVMALAGVYVWIRKLFGWKPVDEVPEFN